MTAPTEKRKGLSAEIRQRERELRQLRKARKAERPKLTSKPKPRQETDDGFLGWLHEGIPCIACLILGPPGPDQLKGERNPIEAAHQRRNDPRPGWQSNRLGKRVADKQSAPLCRWHHQLAPNACDKAQGKFWDLLSVDVVEYCRALYTAFTECASGREVALRFASQNRIAR